MAQIPVVSNTYVGDGVKKIFDLTFVYLTKAEVFASVNGVNTPFTWLAGSNSSIEFATAPAPTSAVQIYRSTLGYTPLHLFENGVPFLPRYVDENNRQLLYVSQEAIASANAAVAQTAINTEISQSALAAANNATGRADAAYAKAVTAEAAANSATATANASSELVNAQAALVATAVNTAQQADVKATEALELVNQAGVASFNTRTGAVVPTAGDYTAAQITSGTGTVADRFTALAASGHLGVVGAINESQMNNTDLASGRYAVVKQGLGILPLDVNSYLDVYDNASANFARQRVAPVTTNREFTRNCVAGTWQAYTEAAAGNNTFVSTKTALRAVVKGSAVAVTVLGDTVPGDGGGASYYYDVADTTSTDNGGTLIVATDGGRWKMVNPALATVATFGGKGDNSTDNSPVVTRMLTAGLRNIVYGAGTWLHRSNITVPQAVNLSVSGLGFRQSQVAGSAAVGFAIYDYQRTNGSAGTVATFKDLAFVWSGTNQLTNSSAIKYYGFSDAASDNWFRTEDCTFQNFDIARSSKWAGQCYSTRDFFANNRYDNRLLRGCSFWYFTGCMSFSRTFILAQDTTHDAFSNGLFIDQCHNITATAECVNVEGWQAVFIDSCGWDLGSGGAAALYFSACQDVYVDKCFISSNGVADRRGVQFVGSHTGAVTNCTLVNNRQGVTVDPTGLVAMGTRIVVDGNKFENNRDNDVMLLGGSFANKIINNHFQTIPSRTGTNFEVYANTPGTDGNIIVNNTFRGGNYTIFTGSNSITTPNLFFVP